MNPTETQTKPQPPQLPKTVQNQLNALQIRINNFNSVRTQQLEIAVSDLYTQFNAAFAALTAEYHAVVKERDDLKKQLEEATKKP
jgi:chromosome segregation ATPase